MTGASSGCMKPIAALRNGEALQQGRLGRFAHAQGKLDALARMADLPGARPRIRVPGV